MPEWRLFGLVVRRNRCRKRVFHRGVRMTHPCLGGNCLPRVCGNWDRDLAALTPRCAAGPYRWSMGNPAHTATQGVSLRIQGPKHPPIGPNTPTTFPASHAAKHAREDEANTGNERPPRTSRAHTHKVAQASSHFHRRGQRRQRGRQRNHPQRPGSINPSMRSWALQVEHGQPRPHRHPRG